MTQHWSNNVSSSCTTLLRVLYTVVQSLHLSKVILEARLILIVPCVGLPCSDGLRGHFVRRKHFKWYHKVRYNTALNLASMNLLVLQLQRIATVWFIYKKISDVCFWNFSWRCLWILWKYKFRLQEIFSTLIKYMMLSISG